MGGRDNRAPKSLPLLKPLLRIPAPKRFLSCEPLLAPLVPGFDLTGYSLGDCQWRRPQPVSPECLAHATHWMRVLRDLCVDRGSRVLLEAMGSWRTIRPVDRGA